MRENADQNNSEYGHVSRSVHQKVSGCSARVFIEVVFRYVRSKNFINLIAKIIQEYSLQAAITVEFLGHDFDLRFVNTFLR